MNDVKCYHNLKFWNNAKIISRRGEGGPLDHCVLSHFLTNEKLNYEKKFKKKKKKKIQKQ